MGKPQCPFETETLINQPKVTHYAVCVTVSYGIATAELI